MKTMTTEAKTTKKIKLTPGAVRYWLQEQAPNGGWFDSIGLSPGTTLQHAKYELVGWRDYVAKYHPRRGACRLIERVDIEITI